MLRRGRTVSPSTYPNHVPSPDTKYTSHAGPYSHFKVGCALLPKNPQTAIIIGANVENAAYPVGTCAERVALGTAVVQGLKYGDLKALAVATNSAPGNPASPCGMCRQFIREFCEPETPIIMFDREGEFVIKTLEEVRTVYRTGTCVQTTNWILSCYPCHLGQIRCPHRSNSTRLRQIWQRSRLARWVYLYD
jgi:homotetrameric cytidine deaminase